MQNNALPLIRPLDKIYKTLYGSLRAHVPGEDFFIADSERVVLRLLGSHLEIESVLSTPEWIEQHLPHIPPQVLCLTASKDELKEVVGFLFHQGVMARAKIPPISFQDLILSPGRWVYLNNVVKAENVGAIIRNARAFQLSGILFDGPTIHPYHRRAVRTSMGTIFDFPFHLISRPLIDLPKLKALGFRLYAFENRSFSKPLREVNFAKNAIFLFGSEGAGLDPELIKIADECVKIPLNPDVDALNIACATAIAFETNTK